MRVEQIVFAIIICLFVTRSGHALPPFRSPLEDRYAQTDLKWRQELRRANCNICHIRKKEKRFVNAYGKLLADLIPGNAQDRLAAAKSIGDEARAAEYTIVMHELGEAIKKAEDLRDSAGVTHGELFRSRKLPSGDERHALREKQTSGVEP